jgi:uroporphyrin-3 C-methyltransferase
VLIALIVLALLGWQWFETRSRLLGLEQTLATRLSAADAVSAEARTLAKDTREAQRLIEERIGALDARLAQMQGQQGALDQLYQELARTRDDRLLAEAEQAINIANQQLQLAGNVGAALLALQGADAQLARSDRAHFLPLRKALHRDIDRLKALPAVDVPGMTLKIESLLAGVDALPLAFERKPGPAPREEAPPAGAVRALVADIWREIRALVRVERMDRPDPGLISPSQSVFLRENLKLRLLDARLALLARDDRVFKEDIKQALVWVESYFDNAASVTQATLEALSQLGQARLSIELPVLTESLAAVKAVQGLPERAPVSRGGR